MATSHSILSRSILSRSILVTGLALAASITSQPAQAQISGFSSGFTFNHGGDATHGGDSNDGGKAASVAGNVLTITDLSNSEANSAIFGTKQSMSAFNAAFTYTDVGGGGANGFTFFFENDTNGTAALGGRGSGMGYGSDDSGGRSHNYIANSAALGFNVYTGNGAVAGTNFMTAGSGGTSVGSSFIAPGSVKIGSGDAIAVALKYDGTTLFESLTDTTTLATYSTSYTTNLVSAVGSTAFVGFAGGTGGLSANQTISGFSFAAPPAVPEASTTVSFGLLLALGLGGLVVAAKRKKASSQA